MASASKAAISDCTAASNWASNSAACIKGYPFQVIKDQSCLNLSTGSNRECFQPRLALKRPLQQRLEVRHPSLAHRPDHQRQLSLMGIMVFRTVRKSSSGAEKLDVRHKHVLHYLDTTVLQSIQVRRDFSRNGNGN